MPAEPLTEEEIDRMLAYRCRGEPNDLCKDREAIQCHVKVLRERLAVAEARAEQLEAALRESHGALSLVCRYIAGDRTVADAYGAFVYRVSTATVNAGRALGLDKGDANANT